MCETVLKFTILCFAEVQLDNCRLLQIMQVLVDFLLSGDCDLKVRFSVSADSDCNCGIVHWP